LDDVKFLHHFLDAFCLDGAQDPTCSQRLNMKDLYCAYGCRPIFPKPRPPLPAPAAHDLYAAGKADLSTRRHAVQLADEVVLPFYKAKSGGPLKIVGIITKFYSRKKLSGGGI
jgi:hypothetical protein